MFGKHSPSLENSTRPVAPVAVAEPRTGQAKKHEPSETVRASVDRLIDQANRFSKRNESEMPERLRASFQFD